MHKKFEQFKKNHDTFIPASHPSSENGAPAASQPIVKIEE